MFCLPRCSDAQSSEQYATAYRSFYGLQFFQCQIAVFLVDVDNDIANLFVGLQILTADIDVVVAENPVDFRHDARHVLMDVQQAVVVRMRR